MLSVNKISPVIHNINAGQTKHLAKKALPAASALGVLAGASLSGMNPPFDVAPLPSGASVTDPFLDQLEYTGDMAVNCAKEIGSAIAGGAHDAIDSVLDFIGDAIDAIS